MQIRLVNKSDHNAIANKIFNSFWKDNPKSWHKFINPHKTLQSIIESKLVAVILEETYLLLVHPTTPWYTDKTFLQELLVLKLYDGNCSLFLVPKALDYLANSCGCAGVLAGATTARDPEILLNLYGRYGYEQQSGFVFKEV